MVIFIAFALVLLVGRAAPPAVRLTGGAARTPAVGLYSPVRSSSSLVSGSPSAAPGSARPGTGPSGTSAGVDPVLAPYLAHLPAFGPPLPPRPITVPVGPAVPIYTRLPVSQPVAFMTMDDGWTQLPQAVELMRAAHIPFTMFLLAPVAAKSPAFFTELKYAGGTIEDHTISHQELRGAGYALQRHEICDARTTLVQAFGGTGPALFGPPYGGYDQTTLRAAHDCGLRAILNWSETVESGVVRYQTAVHRIEPGDIILMHFRPTFIQDVIAALTAIHDAGLTPALLENYLT